MEAFVIEAQVQPGKMREMLQVLESEVLPALKQHPRYEDSRLLISGDAAMLLAYFSGSCPALEAETYFGNRVSPIAGLLLDSPQRRTFEVYEAPPPAQAH